MTKTIANTEAMPKRASWLLNELIISNGPIDVLGPYFLAAERQVAKLGVHLSFGTPTELLEVNQLNRDSWLPLVPMYDKSFNDLDEANFIVIIGRADDGEVVTANAVRLYDWRETDFIAEAQSLRMMYKNAAEMQRPGEVCQVTSERASEINGLAAFSGAAWVHPKIRGLRVSNQLPVLIKALAVSQWKLGVVFGMMSDGVYNRGFARRFGFNTETWEARWKNGVHGDVRFAILWASPGFVVSLASEYLGRVDAEFDISILNGTTN